MWGALHRRRVDETNGEQFMNWVKANPECVLCQFWEKSPFNPDHPDPSRQGASDIHSLYIMGVFFGLHAKSEYYCETHKGLIKEILNTAKTSRL